MPTKPRVLATLSAYACEGGFDGRYQPATCFSPTIALGRHPGPGSGEGLWENYERVLDLAAEMGLVGVSFEVSWARLEPHRGRRDGAALARYAEVVTYAQRQGLFVNVAAIDAAWPAWLGQEAWLMPWVMPVAVDYVSWVSSSLGADSWSVFAAREDLTRGFLDERAGPPWRRGAHADALSAATNLRTIEAGVRSVGGATFVTSAVLDLDDVGDYQDYDVDEVHVRSLVRGAGPLTSPRALLARHGEQWVRVDVDVASELRVP